MKTAHYIGRHDKDTLAVQVGWKLTKLVQSGIFKDVTHSESILQELPDGSCRIGSSSARDGGVRTKQTPLTAGHWMIIDVPSWDVNLAELWYLDPKHRAAGYGWLSAIAAGLPFLPGGSGIFCNQAVGAPFLCDSRLFTPAEFACICLSFGKDVTTEFFGARR